MVVGQINVDELRKGVIGDHAIEIGHKLQRASLVRDVEVKAGIVRVEASLSGRVVGSEDSQHRLIHEVRLAQASDLRGDVAQVGQWIGDVEQVRMEPWVSYLAAKRIIESC